MSILSILSIFVQTFLPFSYIDIKQAFAVDGQTIETVIEPSTNESPETQPSDTESEPAQTENTNTENSPSNENTHEPVSSDTANPSLAPIPELTPEPSLIPTVEPIPILEPTPIPSVDPGTLPNATELPVI